MRFGLVGVRRGSGYARLMSDHRRCTIEACCDTSAENLAKLQEDLGLADSQCFPDFDAMLDSGIDAVCVATPIPCHAEQAIKALEAGMHVLCEVTMARTVEECRQVVEAARHAKGTYMLAENCNFWPFLQQWRDMVRAGKLGEIAYAECEYLHPIRSLLVNPETGERLWRADRPPLVYCTHSLGPILEILDDRIVRISALGKCQRVMPNVGVGAIDIQVALCQTAKDTIIRFARTSVLPRKGAHHVYRLLGTRGHVESNSRALGQPGWHYLEGETESGEDIECPLVDETLPESARKGGHGTAEYALLETFLDAVESGTKPWLNEENAFNLTVPGLIAHESATQDGQWLDVPTPPE